MKKNIKKCKSITVSNRMWFWVLRQKLNKTCDQRLMFRSQWETEIDKIENKEGWEGEEEEETEEGGRENGRKKEIKNKKKKEEKKWRKWEGKWN